MISSHWTELTGLSPHEPVLLMLFSSTPGWKLMKWWRYRKSAESAKLPADFLVVALQKECPCVLTSKTRFDTPRYRLRWLAVGNNIADGAKKYVWQRQIICPDLPLSSILFGKTGHKIRWRWTSDSQTGQKKCLSSPICFRAVSSFGLSVA
jgi:hypothetical protein